MKQDVLKVRRGYRAGIQERTGRFYGWGNVDMTFHIAYACDDYYVEQTIVSMVSLFENNRSQDIIVYLVEDHMCRENIGLAKQAAAVYHQRLVTVPLQELLKDIVLTGDGRHPDTVYAKLFLNRVCGAERILYLDSDTVIVGPLLPLWEMDLDGISVAGVRMPYSGKIKRQMGLDAQDIYVCDGILLIHLKKWREDHFEQKCRAFIRKKNGQPVMCSEGVINFVAKKHVRVLPASYNLMSGMILWNSRQIRRLYHAGDYYTQTEIQEAVQCPVIIHYLDELYIRPWFADSDHPLKNKYRYYRQKAGFHKAMPAGKLKIRTRAVRLLNAYLPFGLFAGLYRMVKKVLEVCGVAKKVFRAGRVHRKSERVSGIRKMCRMIRRAGLTQWKRDI